MEFIKTYSLYPPCGLNKARYSLHFIVSFLLFINTCYVQILLTLLNILWSIRFSRIALKKGTERSKNGS